MSRAGTYRTRLCGLIVVLTFLVAGERHAVEGQAPLPPAREIVAKHIAALGGEAAHRAISSVRVRGRFEIPAQRIAGDLELLSARPAKQLMRATVPGIGRIENGYDGRIGWSIGLAGPELLTGRQLAEVAEEAWFDAALHQEDRLKEMTTVARTSFDDRSAFKVRVVLVSGHEQFEYFDTETGLQIGTEASRATPLGVLPVVDIYRDYRKFGALLQPATLIQRAFGSEQVVTIMTCEYDVVPDTAFDLPAVVRALVRP